MSEPGYEHVLDDAVRLMLWACERDIIGGDDRETHEGPPWLAERLHEPPTRALAADMLTLAGIEARRLIEELVENPRIYAQAMAHVSAFEARAREQLERRRASFAGFACEFAERLRS